MITTGGPDRAQRRPVIVGKGVAKSAWLATGPAPFLPQSPGCDRVPADSPVFSATQDVHDGDVRGGHVDSGIPGIWRWVGGHGGADLVMVSRRGEQLAAVSVAGPGAGMAVPGTGGRRSAGGGGHEEAGQAEPAGQRPGHLRPVPEVAPGAVHGGGHGVQRVAQRRPRGL